MDVSQLADLEAYSAAERGEAHVFTMALEALGAIVEGLAACGINTIVDEAHVGDIRIPSDTVLNKRRLWGERHHPEN